MPVKCSRGVDNYELIQSWEDMRDKNHIYDVPYMDASGKVFVLLNGFGSADVPNFYGLNSFGTPLLLNGDYEEAQVVWPVRKINETISFTFSPKN